MISAHATSNRWDSTVEKSNKPLNLFAPGEPLKSDALNNIIKNMNSLDSVVSQQYSAIEKSMNEIDEKIAKLSPSMDNLLETVTKITKKLDEGSAASQLTYPTVNPLLFHMLQHDNRGIVTTAASVWGLVSIAYVFFNMFS